MTARLECRGLTAARESVTVLRDLELTVDSGRILTLLGPNGAGKTTLLLTLAGLLPARAGTVSVDGVALRNASATQANRAGLVLVPDNRCLFTSLTVEQNLEVPRRRGGPMPKDLLSTFPALERRWKVSAGALSGGEQQMLAMARALIQQPKVLLIDEMSMGLAPLVVESLFETVRGIADEQGTAIVLVEQHVKLSLDVADEAIVLNHGQVVLQDRAEALRDDDRVERAYFDELDDPPATAGAGADQVSASEWSASARAAAAPPAQTDQSQPPPYVPAANGAAGADTLAAGPAGHDNAPHPPAPPDPPQVDQTEGPR